LIDISPVAGQGHHLLLDAAAALTADVVLVLAESVPHKRTPVAAVAWPAPRGHKKSLTPIWQITLVVEGTLRLKRMGTLLRHQPLRQLPPPPRPTTSI
jgi:hypothetical protein